MTTPSPSTAPTPLPPGLLAQARIRVRRKMSFYIHAAVFTAAHLAMAAKHVFMGANGSPRVLWGWAFGLALHGAWVWFSLHSEPLRERMLRQEIERLKKINAAAGSTPPPPAQE